ncbi:MAG TPA: beta-propeller fold lactonase family protein [Chthonomonadales bacterium]|nr:beta-propeller fold lactonase family protein [Chthonomonadales bacterium]
MRGALMWLAAGLAMGSIGAAARAETPVRSCITDPAGWYRDPPERIERRFREYRRLGVDTLRVEIDWRSCEPERGQWSPEYLRNYLTLARRHGFRLKLILGALMAPPAWFLRDEPEARIVDQNGQWSANTISFWYPRVREVVRETTERLLRDVELLGVWDLCDEIIPALGPAGEPIYPVPWTLGTDGPQTMWCYDANAHKDFRAAMRRRYGSVAAANRRWGTHYGAWAEVGVLPPGARPGAYWEDVLTWYRDTKREFIAWYVEWLRCRIGRDRSVLIYLPGTALSDADWQEAVRTGRGNDRVLMMADNFHLIDLAAATGSRVQFTGAENAPEAVRLRRYADARGYTRLAMWAENAGVPQAASGPLHLARVVIQNRMVGLDYTHAHFIFERDGVTPNRTAELLARAYARIKAEARPDAPAPRGKRLLAIGTYTQRGSLGIYLADFDPETGQVGIPDLVAHTESPSFLAFSPRGDRLFAVNETGEFGGERGGGLSAFAVEPRTGALTLTGVQPTGGAYPCHLAVAPDGRHVLVANYGGGSVSVVPVLPDGQLGPRTALVQHSGSGPNQERQEAPHAHSVNLSPDGRFAYVCDLGLDRVMVYQFDGSAGTLAPAQPPWAATAPGAGPRHLALHPNGRIAYVINELDSTITAFRRDRRTGALTALQTVSTLPDGWRGQSTTAEVVLHPSGRFVYGSNRGHDSIAVFRVDGRTGRLSVAGHTPTGGSTPRNFVVEPAGAFLLAANQESDSIAVFRIDPATGGLQDTGHRANVPAPVCLRFLPAAR